MSESAMYATAAVVLGIAGLLVLSLALFRDRSRGRRRCPKCWYDLSASGNDNLRCSECGHAARRERKLYKTRRHWRWAGVGMCLLCGAVAAAAWPHLRNDQWVSLAPNSVLVFCVPDVDDATNAPTWKSKSLGELANRLHSSAIDPPSAKVELWTWQRRMLSESAMSYLEQHFTGNYNDAVTNYNSILTQFFVDGFLTESEDFKRLGALRKKFSQVRIELSNQCYSDQPILFGFRSEGPFDGAVFAEVTINVDGRLEKVSWDYADEPYVLICSTGEPRFRGLIHPIKGLVDGEHTFSFSVREYVTETAARRRINCWRNP